MSFQCSVPEMGIHQLIWYHHYRRMSHLYSSLRLKDHCIRQGGVQYTNYYHPRIYICHIHLTLRFHREFPGNQLKNHNNFTLAKKYSSFKVTPVQDAQKSTWSLVFSNTLKMQKQKNAGKPLKL